MRLLSTIRLEEVLVLQGAPLFGALFSLGTFNRHSAVALLLLAVGSSLLVAHVFLVNDWSGINHDLRDPSRSAGVFLNRGVRRAEVGALSLVLLVLSMVLFSQLGGVTLSIGLMMAMASALYSVPGIHFKGVPVLNSALHLLSGLLHFLLGYSVFHALDGRSLEIGCFFAAIFSAGHLTHEVRDYGADLRNGIRTNAVQFGKVRSFLAGFALFTLADGLLLLLAIRGTVPYSLVLVAALYPLHCYWALGTLRSGLTFDSVRQHQLHYRGLYACIGVIMVVSLLLT